MSPGRKTPQATLKVTQVRSRIGNQRRIVKVLTDGLGLGRIGSSVELPDTPYTRGMIAKVTHMVSVEEIAPPPQRPRRRKSDKAGAAGAETEATDSAAADSAAVDS
jgi:large subunit ribosomal protein L30